MQKISFVVYGKPQAKQRPRFTRSGHVYTPKETASYENLVKISYREKYGEMMLKNAIRADITVSVAIPKSVSKKKFWEMQGNNIYPTKKPDCDNIIKSILDSLNGVAYEDDKQVVKVSCVKLYGNRDSVLIELQEI
mgnify:FL=1